MLICEAEDLALFLIFDGVVDLGGHAGRGEYREQTVIAGISLHFKFSPVIFLTKLIKSSIKLKIYKSQRSRVYAHPLTY